MKSPLGCGADRVVPLAVKRMPLEADGRHLRVGDGHAAGVAALIDLRPNAQTGAAVRGTDQAHDGGQIHEWRAAPVHRDVREQAMFDAVPLAGARRKVTDGDREAGAIREALQFPFPQSEARPLAATGIGSDDERAGLRIRRPPHAVPPAADRVYRNAGPVVIDADADPPFIALEIVDAVRDGFPVAGRRDHEVMDAHPVRSPFWTPGAAAILEVANQFFLLRVDRD